jgi:hypothetical protein
MGSLPFVESFVLEVLWEDINIISSLFMFINLHVASAMISLCYAQQLCYVQHIVFPSLGILQHYTKFDACTIAMLEKLLGLGSFGTTMSHLVDRSVIISTFSRELGLPLVVQLYAFTFLGC